MLHINKRTLIAISLAFVFAFGAGAALRAYERPEGPSGFTAKTLVKAKRQMVVAANPLAAEAGLAILRKGGSAVDAAIATQMVLNVVEPQSSGIGGGAFLLTWDAASKTLLNFDGRETAPAAATADLFLDSAGKPLPRNEAMESGRSVGVPGVLAALKLAHDKYGKLPWSELFAPAIKLSRDGFSVSFRLAEVLNDYGPASFTPAARAYFFDPAGHPRPEGYRLSNPALASTLEAIAREGPSAFYEGAIARDIAAAVQNDPRGPGKLTTEDLANYRAKLREPVCVLYRGFDVCGAAPPSSGAITVGQVLALIEPFDLGSAPMDVEPVHRIVEAERLAFADRNRYLADPDFVTAPVSGLLDRTYIDQRRALIDPNRALGEASAGTPPNTRQGTFGRDANSGERRHQPHFHRRRRRQRRVHDNLNRAGVRQPRDGARLSAQQSAHRFLLRLRRRRGPPCRKPRRARQAPAKLNGSDHDLRVGTCRRRTPASLPAWLAGRARHHPVQSEGHHRHARLAPRPASRRRARQFRLDRRSLPA